MSRCCNRTPLPVARELAPAGPRSGPKIFAAAENFVRAAHSSGSELPRHSLCTTGLTALVRTACSTPAPTAGHR
ncbi:hypothetical protein EJA72_21880 [Pseudomonas sp. PB120]|nr:hypothetical protein [Pseudomonas sp. PB120]